MVRYLLLFGILRHPALIVLSQPDDLFPYHHDGLRPTFVLKVCSEMHDGVYSAT